MIYLGGWPVVKSHNWDEFSWKYQNIIQNTALLGLSSSIFFSFGVLQDLKDETKRILMVVKIIFKFLNLLKILKSLNKISLINQI